MDHYMVIVPLVGNPKDKFPGTSGAQDRQMGSRDFIEFGKTIIAFAPANMV
jgi:hypothetical protein